MANSDHDAKTTRPASRGRADRGLNTDRGWINEGAAATPTSDQQASEPLAWEIEALVAKQAEDEGLWFQAKYASEAYLQAELRKLHAAVEDLLGEIGPLKAEIQQRMIWLDAYEHECASSRPTAVSPNDRAREVLRFVRDAINPPDLGGLSLHQWNQRLKHATAEIDAVFSAAVSPQPEEQKVIKLTSDQLARIFDDMKVYALRREHWDALSADDRFILFDIAMDSLAPQPRQSGTLSVLAWAQERLVNTVLLQATKQGADRDGWAEDESYWRQIVALLVEKDLAPSKNASNHSDQSNTLASQPEGWQPIASAPKDGTVVDVWLGTADAEECEFYCGSRDYRRSTGWTYREGRFRPCTGVALLVVTVKPTHWRPLPPAPTGAPELKGDLK